MSLAHRGFGIEKSWYGLDGFSQPASNHRATRRRPDRHTDGSDAVPADTPIDLARLSMDLRDALGRGFFSYDVSDQATLTIPGYSELSDAARRWWNFDIFPGWQRYTDAPLPVVCARQWLGAHRAIVRDLTPDAAEAIIRIRFEDLLNPMTRAATLTRIHRFARLPDPPPARPYAAGDGDRGAHSGPVADGRCRRPRRRHRSRSDGDRWGARSLHGHKSMVTPPSPVPAAYHGPGWRDRPGTLAEEITDGWPWASMRVHREYDTLTDVALHTPTAHALTAGGPDEMQHLGRMDATALPRDMDRLARPIRPSVSACTSCRTRPGSLAGGNAMYVRDLFWMTGEGALISRMASPARTGEELQAQELCTWLHIPVLRTISGAALFEGADALWLRPDLVAVGIGRRTNRAGAESIAEEAHRQGAETVFLDVPAGIQHLLGTMQVLDADLLAIRSERLDPDGQHRLLEHGFDLIDVPETPEVVNGYAFNFVVIGTRRVVMTDGSGDLRAVLAARGVDCAAVVAVPELFRGAGGIACATGILARRSC
ncbi:dimethylarginine dimethylaminohydrolase family protein [Actinoplanes derwentensis]|uniref:N-Dimethylarginine dimethylaminohydrolase n=1 Tax=Actinoplanes derwentensis TaxID=113562 RepID=A0A1H2CR54_9ACTN|nr:arginine deiminase family protein [Actinoplanes derwentensis]SDT72998.1 N-Dimethylarginine dimethylaminohydrolase [Actinoplanes derwentensis]